MPPSSSPSCLTRIRPTDPLLKGPGGAALGERGARELAREVLRLTGQPLPPGADGPGPGKPNWRRSALPLMSARPGSLLTSPSGSARLRPTGR
jgi:hypothetical protein